MNVDLKSFRWALPSTITSLSILCGSFAMFQLLMGSCNEGFYTVASWLIIVAALIDGVDGKVARLTNTSSEFGIQFDSMADIITFGVATSLLVFRHTIAPQVGTSPAYYLIPLIFLLCSAIRLARFNTTATTGSKKGFVGMPAPSAASSVAALYLFYYAAENIYGLTLPEGFKLRFAVAWVLMVSLLMVSRVEFSIVARFFWIGNRKHWFRFSVNVLIVAYMILGYIFFDDAGTAFFLLGCFYVAYHLARAAKRRFIGPDSEE